MTTITDIHSLRSEFHGPVVSDDDASWESARQAWNLAVDQRPAGVVFPESADDVIAAVQFAHRRGLTISAQGTGHGAGALAPLENSLLLKTSRMAAVEIDAPAGTARVQAGALWGDVAVRAAEHGLAALAGSSPDVGVVGYTLGGGLGWLGRRHGLACNSVRSVDVVTGEGELLRVDAASHPELFWALRGGGGSFGVVTAIEFDLYPAPRPFAGLLVWNGRVAEDVIEAYRAWVRDVPDELTSVVRFLNLPDFPGIPEPMAGKSVVTVDATYLGGADAGDELLAPLRAIEGLEIDTFGPVGPAELRHLHGDPDQPTAGVGDGWLISELTADAAEAFVSVGGPRSASPLVSLELRHLGGALGVGAPGHGALDRLDAEFALYGVGSITDPPSRAPIERRLDEVAEVLSPWAAEQSYLNFSDRRPSASTAFSGVTHRRLEAVKGGYDPADIFRSNHPITSSTDG